MKNERAHKADLKESIDQANCHLLKKLNRFEQSLMFEQSLFVATKYEENAV